MSTLSDLIASLADWESKTAAQLLDELNDETVQYRDHTLWTWAGIADVTGSASAESLRLALDANGMGWAVHQLGGRGIDLCRDDVQAALYALDSAGVSGMGSVALAVKRMISPLESAGLEGVTLEQVAAAQLGLFKSDWSQRFATILNQIGTDEESTALTDLSALTTEILG